MARILDGIRILDLTQFFAGPHATLLLAGLGAEVIRIDNPAGDTLTRSPPFIGPEGATVQPKSDLDLGIPFLKRCRAKKAITLNLKSDRGREMFLDLAEKSDVVVENFRVGVSERLGIDYPRLKPRNPRLVHCSLTGFGLTGPDRHRPAYDVSVQAASGLMAITGFPDGPPVKAGSALADAIASVFAFSGVLAALFHAHRTGEGQQVDVSMTDAVFALIFDEALDCYEQLGFPMRQGNRIPRLSPFNTYQTLDGWIVIGAATDAQWLRLVEAMGRDDLVDDPDFKDPPTRLANNLRVDREINAWTRARTTADAYERLKQAEIVSSPIHGIDDIKAWPQMRVRQMVETLVHPFLGPLEGVGAAGFPLKFSATESGYDAPAAMPGTHNAEIYGSLLGLDAGALAQLKAASVI